MIFLEINSILYKAESMLMHMWDNCREKFEVVLLEFWFPFKGINDL